ncbi:MAG: CpaF family protein [Planctomycetota bacterium]
MLHDEIVDRANEYLLHKTSFLATKDHLSRDEMLGFLDGLITEICHERKLDLGPRERQPLIQMLARTVIGIGPLRPLMQDESVTEIMVNGPDQVFVERHGKMVLSDVKFQTESHLLAAVQRLLVDSNCNKRLDTCSPYVDFCLPDGSRVNAVVPPCSAIGPVVTIRKFRKDITEVDDLLALGMLDERIAALLIAAMRGRLNVVFCGATGSGKTTALNVFSRHIPDHERIITIEDTPELQLRQEHVVTLTSKPANIEGKGTVTIRELFVNALRMRPERIILGEIRGAEMFDLIQAIATGHSGALAIVHASSPRDCFDRMATLVLLSGIGLSLEQIERHVARAIDLIVHVELFPDGKRRVAHVATVHPQTQGVHTIFEYVPHGDEAGTWRLDPAPPPFLHKLERRRVTLPQGLFAAVTP